METEEAGKLKFSEIKENLFFAPPDYSLAHCVGADFVMEAGIAVKFKQIFGMVDELRAQNIGSGGVAILADNTRYIYYLVTKSKSLGSTTYNSLRSSLIKMREHMRENQVKKLAIPRIGCGNDGLEWPKVRAELETVFGPENMEIVVYNSVPN